MAWQAAEKLCWAVVAIRKRYRSASWRNPTAYTPYGVCCARSTVFQQSN